MIAFLLALTFLVGAWVLAEAIGDVAYHRGYLDGLAHDRESKRKMRRDRLRAMARR